MPSLEQLDLAQTALLWPAYGWDYHGQPRYDADGEPIVGPPEEIEARFSIKQAEMVDPKGNSIVVQSTAVVDRRVREGSLLWIGTLDDWLGTGSAGDDNELYEVRAYAESPDLKNRYVRRTVGLMRYRNQPNLAT